MADGILSVDQVRDAIARLTEADLFRLHRAVRLCAVGLDIDAADLVNEAICRALDGSRRCPAHLPVPIFLVGVVRSIASAARERAKERPAVRSLSVSAEDGGVVGVAANERTAEEALIAKEEFAAQLLALEEMFGGDEEAQLMIMCDRDGMPAERIRAELSMDETTYATARRRIRRKVHARFPKGWTS